MNSKAVIDVGTNSVKLLVVSSGGGDSRVLRDRVEVVRLGEGTAASGCLGEDAMARALAAIRGMAGEARELGADEIAAVGTQALRQARNGADFIGRVREACGVAIEPITGEEEAELSFAAAASGLAGLTEGTPVRMFDVGGGSTEIVTGDGGRVRSRVSVPVGALALHGEFFAGLGLVGEAPLAAASSRVRSLLAAAGASPHAGPGPLCVGVGGTITTLASVTLGAERYDGDAVSGLRLSLAEVGRQIALYASTPLGERPAIPGLDPRRADIILAGACVVRELLLSSGADGLTVSSRGLRYGVMRKRFGA